MTKTEVLKFTSWLGRRSYKARLERFGLARLQEIARKNGKKGGRPPKKAAEGRTRQPEAGANK
jgi:hypothetical protein